MIDKPTHVVHIDSTDTLYVAFKTAGKLAKINLDTGDVSFVLIDRAALSLVIYNDRAFFTSRDVATDEFNLYSIGDDDVPVHHGIIYTDLITINPVTGEIVGSQTGSSPAAVIRYGLDSDGLVFTLQATLKFGGTAQDLTISPDGQQLAASTGGGDANGYAIQDVSASDLNISNGGWFTGAYPGSADFSASGALFVSTDKTDLMIF